MKLEDARKLASRRWDLVERLEAEHWVQEKRKLTALQSLRIAEGLRDHVVRLRPGWPSDDERAVDLATHERIARKLARARPFFRR